METENMNVVTDEVMESAEDIVTESSSHTLRNLGILTGLAALGSLGYLGYKKIKAKRNAAKDDEVEVPADAVDGEFREVDSEE